MTDVPKIPDPLLVDVYQGDLHGKPDWTRLVAAGWPWIGAGLKISEGTQYSSDWFPAQWQAIEAAAGIHLGVDFFRYGYHYLRIDEDPVTQAHFCLKQLALVGGLKTFDLPLMVDVEGANNPAMPSTAHVVDSVSSFVEVIKNETGRSVTLYGNIYLWEHGVKDHMGCDHLIVARYTPTLPSTIYERIGWTWTADPAVKPPTVLGWQYCGDGEGDNSVTKYPLVSPIGKVDITALLVANGGQNALDYVKAEMLG